MTPEVQITREKGNGPHYNEAFVLPSPVKKVKSWLGDSASKSALGASPGTWIHPLRPV